MSTSLRLGAIAASLLMAGPAFAQTKAPTPAKTTTAAPAKPATTAKPATAAVHATKGVVKSVDDTSLVITKTAAKGPETTFVLNAATERQGAIAAGAAVDVRYRTEGKTKVATAVSVQEPKAPAAKMAPAAKTKTKTKAGK
jgi:hypothetical protein